MIAANMTNEEYDERPGAAWAAAQPLVLCSDGNYRTPEAKARWEAIPRWLPTPKDPA